MTREASLSIKSTKGIGLPKSFHDTTTRCVNNSIVLYQQMIHCKSYRVVFGLLCMGLALIIRFIINDPLGAALGALNKAHISDKIAVVKKSRHHARPACFNSTVTKAAYTEFSARVSINRPVYPHHPVVNIPQEMPVTVFLKRGKSFLFIASI